MLTKHTDNVPTIGFAGLTHLGVVSQAAAASLGFSTRGFSPDPILITQLANGCPPIVEPGLPELFSGHADRLFFGDDPAILHECDLVFISSDVPTDDRGGSDLSPVLAMARTVLPAIRPEAVLVVLCQVPPGFTRELGKIRARVFYQVETLVFGKAVERALAPERIIIGCADPTADLPPFYSAFLRSFSCPLLPMRYESAELAKVSINLFLAASVCTTNVLAELCERCQADWHEIAPAVRLDRRIGPFAYLTPGLGLSGGNIERDLATVLRLAEQTGGNASLVRSWLADSMYRKNWVLRQLFQIAVVSTNIRLGILGLSYKENTASTKNSPSLALLEALTASGHHCAIKVFDPAVPAAALSLPSVDVADSAYAACESAQVLIVMTPWPEFASLDLARIRAAMNATDDGSRWLIDPYRVFSPHACAEAELRQLSLGSPGV